MGGDPLAWEEGGDYGGLGSQGKPKHSKSSRSAPQPCCFAQDKTVRNVDVIAWKKTSMRWQQRTVPDKLLPCPGCSKTPGPGDPSLPQAPGITEMFTTEPGEEANGAAKAQAHYRACREDSRDARRVLPWVEDST